jgi:hypothetical protein
MLFYPAAPSLSRQTQASMDLSSHGKDVVSPGPDPAPLRPVEFPPPPAAERH